jgi:hypothetical protein
MNMEQSGAGKPGPEKEHGSAIGNAPSQADAQGKERRPPPALLARFPRFFWRPKVNEKWPNDWPVVRQKHHSEYPALADDLAVWGDRLESRFRRLDHRAQILQNQFWREHVILIAGGLLATSLGAIQAAAGGGIIELAAAQALLTGLLAGLTVLIRSRRAQQGYLTTRLKAERIKSEYYLFLARAGDYAKGDPLARLEQQVNDIEAAEGAS